jgi:hypothetical protein
MQTREVTVEVGMLMLLLMLMADRMPAATVERRLVDKKSGKPHCSLLRMTAVHRQCGCCCTEV